MKKFDINEFYKKVGKEIGWTFSKMNYIKESKDNFRYWKRVKENISEKTICLDIGCGSAEKTLKLLEPKLMYCCDYEEEMLKKAKNNLQKYPDKKDNFKFVKMDAFKKIILRMNILM